MYRKFIILFMSIACATFAFAQSQPNDNRTLETKVADIVMQLPAKSTADFNRLMSELVSLGGDIIPGMSAKLTDLGQGDDSQIRYAIAGMATYAGKTNNDSRKNVALGICKSLPTAKSDEVADFLLIQLQYVAGDESVKSMKNYLSNNRLADAAARVLVRINSEASKNTLLEAFPGASGTRLLTIVESLGYTKAEQAIASITPLASSNDPNVRKTALFALANIASPTSEKVLKDAATNAGFTYESSDALAAYLLYLSNLNKKGQKEEVAKAAKNMMDAAVKPEQAHAKSAALNLYTLTAKEKDGISEIIDAIGSDNKKYRKAALAFSRNIASPDMFKALLKKGDKEKRADAKAEIITAFGTRGDKDALPTVLKVMSDKNDNVVMAAMATASSIGGEQAIAPIIKVMTNTKNANVAATGKAALLTIKGTQLTAEVAKAMKAGQLVDTAFLQILAARGATEQAGAVFGMVSATGAIGKEARKALQYVVTEKDANSVSELLNKLNVSNNTDVTDLQQALYAAVKGKSTQEEQTQLVLSQMNRTNNKSAYYNVLAMIGGETGLDIVTKSFNTSANTSEKTLAFEALTNWSDFSAANELYNICKKDPSSSYFDKALMNYVAKINPSNNTTDQKLLLLRRALAIAKTNEQKNEIIKQIGQTGTFLAMVTAGNYLDDSNLQQTAAQAVMNSALKNKYYGKVVTDLLNKVIAVNKNPEADYQKQAILKHLASLPKDDGFVSMFNGKDLSGWKGLVENPIARAKMTPAQLAEKQVKADEIMRRDWKVENGLLVFEGKGYENLCSAKNYGDFEMVVDWRIAKEGDAGVYLRGSPQVQVWDIALTNVGAQVGSGGLYNNQKNKSTPLEVADNAVEEWNTFRIRMVGDKVTVYLNGKLVTDNVTLENYWDRLLPIFSEDAIELQAHGTRVEYRDIYVCEIARPKAYEVSAAEKTEGFVPMFNGIDMAGWVGNLKDYTAQKGEIVCDPKGGGHGNLYTDKEYSDFVMRFEFMLTPAANNGLGIRTPLEGDAAYVGMELQILDNEADVYKDLAVYQYHGSVYGVIPAKRGYLKPVGEWNVQEVIAKGNHITITLNGTVILDGDIAKASKNFTAPIDGKQHPGLSNKSGHIGFLGHGSYLKFRNLRIKDLTIKPAPVKVVKKAATKK